MELCLAPWILLNIISQFGSLRQFECDLACMPLEYASISKIISSQAASKLAGLHSAPRTGDFEIIRTSRQKFDILKGLNFRIYIKFEI